MRHFHLYLRCVLFFCLLCFLSCLDCRNAIASVKGINVDVNTKNILFKIKGKHLKAHYKTSIAISLIVIIVLVILRTTVTGQDSIKFIDITNDKTNDQQNSHSKDIRYSNEYKRFHLILS